MSKGRSTVRAKLQHFVVACLFAPVIAIIPLGGVVILPGEAGAFNCANLGNWQVGYTTVGLSQPQGWEGVSANIYNAGGDILCSTDTNKLTNWVTPWTMVQSGPAVLGYVQAGDIYEYGDSCVREWAAQKQNNNTNEIDYYINGGCSAVGSTQQYWNQLYLSGGVYYYRSNMNTTMIHQTSWSPFGNWVTPYDIDYIAEASYSVNHIPGTGANPTVDSAMEVQYFSDNTWHSACNNLNLGSTNNNAGLYGDLLVSCQETETYTK